MRQPKFQVVLNGSPLDAVFEAEVASNAYFAADRFEFRAALDGARGLDWAALPVGVEILLNIDGTWQLLISGVADTLRVDPIRADLHVTGRDMTSLFIRSQTHESFENLTSSDVAILLAERHGLSVAVTPTATLVGRYYQNGHTRSAMSQHGRATTEWDVLCWLAQQEGFDVWTFGRTLFFQSGATDSQSLTITPAQCSAMKLHRDLDIASGFTVEVQSWDCATQNSVSAQSNYAKSESAVGNLIILRPNLSFTDAQQLAIRTALQLGEHERIITYASPADVVTMPRAPLQLTLTNTDFDGIYKIYEVERCLSSKRGCTQHVLARRASWTSS